MPLSAFKVGNSVSEGANVEYELHHEDGGNGDIENIPDSVDFELSSRLFSEDKLEVNHHWVEKREHAEGSDEVHVSVEGFRFQVELVDVIATL